MSKARDLADSYDNTEIDNKLSLSKSASNVALEGSLALVNSTVTKSNANVTYTGNGTSQSITTGISSVDFTVASNGSGYYHDRAAGDCIVKNDAGTIIESGEAVVNTSKVHIKSRSTAYNNYITDGLIGKTKYISSNLTSAEATDSTALTSYNSNGVSLGAAVSFNNSGSTYILHQTLYTHIKWGLTSQGKRYLTAYNPVTREVMTIYQGSGIAEHQIPNPLGVKLDFMNIKRLMVSTNWDTQVGSDRAFMSLTNAFTIGGAQGLSDINTITVSSSSGVNAVDTYILYGFANSETKIITQYQGTGASGNFVETLDVNGVGKKPRRVIRKAVSAASNWFWNDTKRNDNTLFLNLSQGESDPGSILYRSNGFEALSFANTNGVQFIAIVEFDTNADGDDTYFDLPTDDTNLNVTSAKLPYTNGRDAVNGAYNVFTQSYTGTVDFSTCPDGIHYVALDSNNTPKFYEKVAIGSYEKEAADDNRLVFDTESGKWFTTTSGELVTNGSFDTDLTGWASTGSDLVDNSNVSNGTLTLTRSGANVEQVESSFATTIGKKYKATIVVLSSSTNYTNILIGTTSGGFDIGQNISLSAGTYVYDFIAQSTTTYLTLKAGQTDCVSVFDNVSVYKVEPTLDTALTTPISFIDDKPYQVASGTPMDRLVDYPSIPKNVMESTYVDGDLEVSGDIVTDGEFVGKNACTAWVYFDGTTTPPTIRDSYNVKDVVRTSTGVYEVYFENDMDNTNYSINGIASTTAGGDYGITAYYHNKTKCTIVIKNYTAGTNSFANIQIFGGK